MERSKKSTRPFFNRILVTKKLTVGCLLSGEAIRNLGITPSSFLLNPKAERFKRPSSSVMIWNSGFLKVSESMTTLPSNSSSKLTPSFNSVAWSKRSEEHTSELQSHHD